LRRLFSKNCRSCACGWSLAQARVRYIRKTASNVETKPADSAKNFLQNHFTDFNLLKFETNLYNPIVLYHKNIKLL